MLVSIVVVNANVLSPSRDWIFAMFACYEIMFSKLTQDITSSVVTLDHLQRLLPPI